MILAAGGPLSLTGDDDRPPVRVTVPQAYSHAAAEAAGAALIALHERHRSGLGQHVDVSAQQAVAMATQSNILSAAVGFPELTRVAGGARAGAWTFRFVYPAKDGYVSITFVFGSSIGRFTRRLMEWIHDEGFCDAATRDKDWIAYIDAPHDRRRADRGARAREGRDRRVHRARRRRPSCSARRASATC